MDSMKKYAVPIILLVAFECVAIGLSVILDNRFYFWNFSYIGVSLSIGTALYIAK